MRPVLRRLWRVGSVAVAVADKDHVNDEDHVDENVDVDGGVRRDGIGAAPGWLGRSRERTRNSRQGAAYRGGL
jgi:hypothetical protein